MEEVECCNCEISTPAAIAASRDIRVPVFGIEAPLSVFSILLNDDIQELRSMNSTMDG